MVLYDRFGRTSQKLRTREALKAAAADLIAAGRQPTVVEVAEAAGISRSTAYRYFPSSELMYAELALNAAVDGDRQRLYDAAKTDGDVASRLDRVIRADHTLTQEHEAELRTGLRAFLLLLESYPEVALEPSHRVQVLTEALAPLADRLSQESMRRLVAALSLCVGVEAALITQVNCGLGPDESESLKRWAASALLRAALEE